MSQEERIEDLENRVDYLDSELRDFKKRYEEMVLRLDEVLQDNDLL